MTATLTRPPKPPPAAAAAKGLGTDGWTIDDYYRDDFQEEFGGIPTEIVDGVLIVLPHQGTRSNRPLQDLRDLVKDTLRSRGEYGRFYLEVDLVLARDRVPEPDGLYLTPEQEARQLAEEDARPPTRSNWHPIYVVPELVVESISPSTARHDRVTKRRWYAEAGVPHYWLLDHRDRSLVCLRLDGGAYVEDAAGAGDALVRASAFGGLDLPLAEIFRG